MTQLSDSARGVGMDSLWRSNGKMLAGHKTTLNTYTVYEYKASKAKSHKSTGQLLGSNKGKKSANKTASGKVVKGGDKEANEPKDHKNQQMSKDWVKDRMEDGGHEDKVGQTSRMVLFFGADAIIDHGLALTDAKTHGGKPDAAKHPNHTASRVIFESEIDETIDRRVNRSKLPKKK
jgi:hypothetical protein